MRLTRAGEYAVRCTLFLSSREPGVVVNRREIAEMMDIPEQFLVKIAQQLQRAGIIEIIQGAKGGFRLVRAPEKTTLLDVVEAISGEIYLNDCILNPDSCSRIAACSVHMVWEKARRQLRDTLREANFAELLHNENCLTSLVSDKQKT